MATYIPNLTDVFPEPSLNKSDFGFFDSMLRRKQAQYDEGVSKAMSARDMIRNAPLSDFANIETRDKYLKEADQALANISSADFSLPQNVNAAMNIFSPFWEDPMLMRDMQLTKQLNGSLSTLMSWRDSKDEKVRSMYNGIAVQYVMNDMERLRNANRDPDNYKNVEGRRAVPFTNIEKYLDDEAAKDPDKLSIKWDDPAGPVLYSMVNGERSAKNFRIWAKSKLGNNFYEQFKVTGVVAAENEQKQIRQKFPNYTDDQVNQEIARKTVKELQEGYESSMSEVDEEINRLNGIISKFPETFSDKQRAAYQSVIDQRNKLREDKQAIQKKYDQFEKNDKNKIFETVVANPERYFATQAEQRLLNQWSTGRAAVSSVSVKENKPFLDAQRLHIQRLNAETARMNAESKRMDAETDRMDTDDDENNNDGGGTSSSSRSRNRRTSKNKTNDADITPDEGQDIDTGGRFVGKNTTDLLQNKQKAWERFVNVQSDLFRNINQLIFDPMGVLQFAKGAGLDMTNQELSHISTALRRYNNGEGPLYKHDDKHPESIALEKLTKNLWNNKEVSASFVSGFKNKQEIISEMLMKYVEVELKKKSDILGKDGNVPFTPEEKEAFKGYYLAKNMLETYWTNEENRRSLVEQNILKGSDPDMKKLIVNKDGKNDLISSGDLLKYFRDKEFQVETEDGVRHTLTANDIALAYLSGNVSNFAPRSYSEAMAASDGTYYFGKSIKIDGVDYGLMDLLALGSPADPKLNRFMEDMSRLEKDFGSSQKLRDTYNKALTSVVPDLMFYKNQSGSMGTTFQYDFDTKKANDNAAKIFSESLVPGNIMNMMIEDENGKIEPMGVQPRNSLINTFSNKEDVFEDRVKGFTYDTIGINGNPTITFTVAPSSKKASGDDDDADPLSSIYDKKVRIELSPNSTGPTMAGLPNPSGHYIFSRVLRGEAIEADPIMKAAGFDFTVVPQNTDKPEYVMIEGNYKSRVIYDESTGELTNKMENVPFKKVIYLRGNKSKSPDQIMNIVMSMFFQSLDDNEQAQKEYDRLSRTVGNGTSSNQSGTSSVFSKKDLVGLDD